MDKKKDHVVQVVIVDFILNILLRICLSSFLVAIYFRFTLL